MDSEDNQSAIKDGGPDKEEYRRKDLIAQRGMAMSAKKAVKIAERQLCWSVAEVLLLVGTVVAAFLGIKAAYNANEATQKAILLELRPWIEVVDVSVSSDFVWNDAGNANMRVVRLMKNHGRTPALKVLVNLKAFPYRGEYLAPQHETKSMCDTLTDRFEATERLEAAGVTPNHPYRPPIFPDENSRHFDDIVVWSDDYERRYDISDGIDKMSVSLVGCVTYTTHSGADIYTTPFTFDLLVLESGGDYRKDIGYQRRDIKRDRLHLYRSINNLIGPD